MNGAPHNDPPVAALIEAANRLAQQPGTTAKELIEALRLLSDAVTSAADNHKEN